MDAYHQKMIALLQEIAPQSRLLRAWKLKGGISAGVTALEAFDAAGKLRRWIVRQPNPVALKQNPRAAEDEFRLLHFLQSAGIPSPAPVYLDRSGKFFPSPFLVIEYIEGEVDFAPADLPGYVQIMAECLARIHGVDLSKQDFSFLPRQGGWMSDAFDPRTTPIPTAFDVAYIRQVLEVIGNLPPSNPPALLHGDYWAGNILWRDGRLVGVIDWEDAGVGDPLRDLAISRLDMMCIFGEDAMGVFTQQYLHRTGVDTTNLPYWDLWAALRLARLAGDDLDVWAAFFHPFGRRDITAASLRSHFRKFTMQALRRLDHPV